MSENQKKLKLGALVWLVVVPTFGFNNITSNVVALGPASIPSWIIVSVIFFLPLTLFIAELSTAKDAGGAGMYSWIETGMGKNWAFLGIWCYACSPFYLAMAFQRIPVMISWVIFGENRFTDETAVWIPWITVIIVILFTFIATQGVSVFAKISDFGGKCIMSITVLFIVFAVLGLIAGHPSQTHFTASSMVPSFNSAYFSTFAWLILAVEGAEVGGTYIKDMEEPRKFPKAIFIATFLIAAAYILGSVTVLFVASPEQIVEAGVQDATYVVFRDLGNQFGLNGGIVVRIYALIFTIASVAANIAWLDSPMRAMFAELPEGTLPKFLSKTNKNGACANALWFRTVIFVFVIILPTVGIKGINSLFALLQDIASVTSVPVYILLGVSFICFRLRKVECQYRVFKSNAVAIVIAVLYIIISLLAYLGAGFDKILYAETSGEAVRYVIEVYGGPFMIMLLGLGIRAITRKYYRSRNEYVEY